MSVPVIHKQTVPCFSLCYALLFVNKQLEDEMFLKG